MYKVLVAEDETIERKVLCKILRSHLSEICTVVEAKNGTEAWELYQSEQPQVALLDIQMPGMTGLELAGRIRDTGRACAIIFLSAYDYFSYARQAIAYRAVDYILKPYGQEELLCSVEEAIRFLSGTGPSPSGRKPPHPSPRNRRRRKPSAVPIWSGRRSGAISGIISARTCPCRMWPM